MIRKRYFLLCFLICIIALSGFEQAAAQDFEGVIHFEVPEMRQSQTGDLIYMIKGDKARLEFGQGNQKAVMLYFSDKNQMVLLMHQMRGYVKFDAREKGQEVSNTVRNSQIEKTGRTKTVAGRSCTIWLSMEDRKEYEICAARGMGNFILPKMPMSAADNTPNWAEEVFSEGFMPLEVARVSSGNRREVKLKATRIVSKSLQESLFMIPSDYEDMSDALMQMGNH
ncbi:MAG: DUF4412 domain-containing protein [Balneolaceae bacterium]|nr:DUF4412 domain-containing protein [Balneolaceae bacterium]